MKARLVVFPIKGRHWCFGRSVERSLYGSDSAHSPSTLRELWTTLSSSTDKRIGANAHLVVDFISNKMNRAWIKLEKAPEGTLKNKIYGLGLRLLARVKPSEIFLKSITREVSNVEVTYPSSLNARLVRRRLRHVALRGTVMHKRYFYGSVSLLPLTTALTVLPLPNIPFFWILFRAYSHWKALKGSEKLLHLVSDGSVPQNSSTKKAVEVEIAHENSPWVLRPSKELEELLGDSFSSCAVLDICKAFDLNAKDVLKYRDVAHF